MGESRGNRERYFRGGGGCLDFYVLADGRLEGGDEVRVHEVVVVGDAEAVDRFVGDGFGEFFAEVGFVFGFHHENEVGPAEEACGDADACGGFGAGGFDGVAGGVAEDFFGGAAAPLVAAADEKEFGGVIQRDGNLAMTRLSWAMDSAS